MENGMENRSKTVAIVIALLLVVVLVWFLFIRGSGDEAEVTPEPTPAAEVVEIDDGQDEAGGEDVTSSGADGTDEVDKTNGEGSETPPGQETPGADEVDDDDDDSDEVTLPEGWEDFSLAEKIAANPYDCDLDAYPNSMWPDGTCHYPADAEVDDDDMDTTWTDMMDDDGSDDQTGADEEVGQS